VPGYLDRRRAAKLMQEQGLSALVLAQPESIAYVTGAFPGVASYWRRAGSAFVVVPADETAPLAAIVGDLQAKNFAAQSGIADVRSHRIWVETERYPIADTAKPLRSPRPAQYDFRASLDLLRDVLAERSLLNERIGLELGFVPAADFSSFSRIPAEWTDCTRIIEQLRAIKSREEIGMLRDAAEYASSGITALTRSIRASMDAAEMTEIWKSAAFAEATRRGTPAPQSAWAYIAVAGDGFAPGGPARPGDIIKIDVGCVINGYSSDGGRTAVLGKPSTDAQRIFDALHRAFDNGFALLKPGVPLKNIYHATATTMWDLGYQTYGRGHFGHGVGASIWSEEWPFIASQSDAILEPGMVLAFETPWYIDGLGGFIIEDQVLITETGSDVMGPSPRELIRI
jgi:Xaa-Pro dipeptidase